MNDDEHPGPPSTKGDEHPLPPHRTPTTINQWPPSPPPTTTRAQHHCQRMATRVCNHHHLQRGPSTCQRTAMRTHHHHLWTTSNAHP
ncbi:uncharacterized protein LACBIDRAFT_307053 [Laccaria bicolor S238N-H82]|uniref:Predicted protein n=1 Tax=Laccaria bicolor (strain S238N-H82 / ATCC MYA-4686) TaxID=486041 RepID=B0DP92_LACBS|nr:uncharacterized protein LACBIDRAFT_307053 [Laccaria bicolor S238N-H82]EDR03643.1 predicted protein [Laccaria bicolor S238N-H82]|eukprot:XP_001885791.1 predicted protein [Laccaria bicolor S238N-H82]